MLTIIDCTCQSLQPGLMSPLWHACPPHEDSHCVCVCACVRAARMNTCMFLHASHVRIEINNLESIQIKSCMHTFTSTSLPQTHKHACTHACMHAHIRAHTHAHTHTHARANSHSNTHICMQWKNIICGHMIQCPPAVNNFGSDSDLSSSIEWSNQGVTYIICYWNPASSHPSRDACILHHLTVWSIGKMRNMQISVFRLHAEIMNAYWPTLGLISKLKSQSLIWIRIQNESWTISECIRMAGLWID